LEGGRTRRYEQLASAGYCHGSWCASLLSGELATCSASLATAIAANRDSETRGPELIGDLLDALRLRFLPWGVRHSVHGNQVDVRATTAQQ
jgi:hypothetical protein